jgi:GT2 family glycosyltransferase
MADVPAVSVVIPLYNKGPYIARALNSVLAQTFQDFEVIVVDDGSTDDGAVVVRGFDDPRIRLIQQENQGVSAARNRGIAAAQADLVAFLDADDEWLPGHLKSITRLSKRYPGAGAYSTAYVFSKTNGKMKKPKYKAIPPKPWEGIIPRYFKSNALGAHPVCSSSVGIPKHIFDEIGGFRIGVWYGEDEDMWGRIALKHPIVFSWDVGAIYHRDTTNRACESNVCRPKTPFVTMAQNMIQSGSVPEKTQIDLQEYIAREEINRAIWCTLNGRTQEAAEILTKCHTEQLIRKKCMVTIVTKIPISIFRNIAMMVALKLYDLVA